MKLTKMDLKPGDNVHCVSTTHPNYWTKGQLYQITKEGRLTDDEGDVTPLKDADKECEWELISRAESQRERELPSWHTWAGRRSPEVLDLTKITTPFGLLDETTQEALRAHCGPWECYAHNGWSDTHWPSWNGHLVYRVKRAPKRETVTRKGFVCASGWVSGYSLSSTVPVTVTFETVDGLMDLSTYRLKIR